jgi:hypothetical protein
MVRSRSLLDPRTTGHDAGGPLLLLALGTLELLLSTFQENRHLQESTNFWELGYAKAPRAEERNQQESLVS